MTPLAPIFDPSVGPAPTLRERPFLEAVLDAAQAAPDWPGGFRSVVVVSCHRRHRRWPALDRAEAPVLLIALGGEDGRIRPELRERAEVLLQNYVTDDLTARTPVLHLPLGPGHSSEPPPLRSWADRTIDVAFVGHLHAKRWGFARSLGAVRPAFRLFPNITLPLVRDRALIPVSIAPFQSHIHWTHRFGAGIDHAEYLALLSQTRIALVPRGFKQTETFRHHEAARAGCVLVGAPIALYPVLEPSGRSLVDALQALLSAPEDLEQRHRRVQDAWTAHGAPAAVGQALATKLARLADRSRR